MKWLAAGITFVNFSTLIGLTLGVIGHGLSAPLAAIALALGAVVAAAAFLQTSDPQEINSAGPRKWSGPEIWFLITATCFALFAARSFCWLIYIEGDQFRIQSPYNLGDLALHITYIKNFASGVALWPDNPIYVFSKLRYPAGIDIFNSLLCRVDVGLIQGLVWVGLLASAATCYAFWRWGGAFGIAGFLFNGGLVGFQVVKQFKFLDYQGDQTIAWKSIPLTMFVTQRGLLYAIPAGLLLLWHWREKFWPTASHRTAPKTFGVANPGSSKTSKSSKIAIKQAAGSKGDSGRSLAVSADGLTRLGEESSDQSYGPLPFWVEFSIYATMPLFHFHTFLALSVVLFCFFALEFSLRIWEPPREEGASAPTELSAAWAKSLLSNLPISKHVLTLVGCAFIPATLFVWLITDHFHAGSVVGWEVGWVQAIKGDSLARPIHLFWFINFGLWLPLALTYVALAGLRAWNLGMPKEISGEIAFMVSGIVIFLMVFFFKLAPWGWDNTKLLIWAYFIALPLFWRYLISDWSIPVRVAVCVALFGSGFVSMVGGLAAGRPGFGFANRQEFDAVGDAVRGLPVEARFACFPTFNHPLLLQGRRVVMGYPGHLWTQGFSDYGETEKKLKEVMQGGKEWRETARKLGVRYIYWGREEDTNYPMSTRPWQRTALKVASGKDWGAIYDLEPASPVKN